MIRFTTKLTKDVGFCWNCGNKASGISTDRVTGDEFWVCKYHIRNSGKCRRNQLHPDFRRNSSKTPSDLHIKKSQSKLYGSDEGRLEVSI